jgi:hypothetical protein
MSSNYSFDTSLIVSQVRNVYGSISVLVIVIGLIGNSLIFYILTRPKFLKVPTFRYFLVNEVIDMIGIALMLTWLIQSSIKWKATALFCKIWEYVAYTCYNMYPCVNSMNSIDRLLSIKYSRRFGFRYKLKFQAIIVLIIILISLVYNVPYFIQVGIDEIFTCAYSAAPIIALSTFLVNFFLTNVIPFIVSMISTGMIINYLIELKRKSNVIRNYKREVALLKSVLAMDILFFFCYLPFCSVNLARAILDFQNVKITWYWVLIHNFASLLLLVAVTCKFFMLWLTNQLFKKEFHSILRRTLGYKDKHIRRPKEVVKNKMAQKSDM